MVSKLLITVALLGIASSASCPLFTCDYTLGTNTCAELSNTGVFLVNGNRCESDFYCSAASLETWALSKNATTDVTFPCSQRDVFPIIVLNEDTYSYETCPYKSTGRNFKTGAAVLFCASNNDCLLEDDTTTTCACVVRSDGQGVCTPDPSNDQVFGGFWADCGEENRITRLEEYNYWTAYIASWMWMQSDLMCLRTFTEVEMLEMTYAIYEQAGLLAASLLVLFAY